MREQVEEALALWREAVRRRDETSDGNRPELDAEIARRRAAFQQLSADYMMNRIDALKEAESRRAHAIPSTEPFHQAARDEAQIAAEIWDSALVNDREAPTNVDSGG